MKYGRPIWTKSNIYPYRFPYNFWVIPRGIFHCIKWSFQRINHGYADIDDWDIDSWFISVMRPMLEDLKEFQGWPGTISEKQWCNELDEMIGLLYEMDESLSLDDDADCNDYDKWEERAMKAKDEFFEKFNFWFYDLWS